MTTSPAGDNSSALSFPDTASLKALVKDFEHHLAQVQKRTNSLTAWSETAPECTSGRSLDTQHQQIQSCLTSLNMGKFLPSKTADIRDCLDRLSTGLRGQEALLSVGLPGAWPATVPDFYKDEGFWNQVTVPLIDLESYIGIY